MINSEILNKLKVITEEERQICTAWAGTSETVEKAAQVYMLTAHLPRINTIKDEEMKELAEYFKVNYRKDFLNL